VTYAPDPEFPKKERKARHPGGTVILGLTVGPDGVPHDIVVSHSLRPDFDEAATNAVKSWRFLPAKRDGKPVAVHIDVEVTFHLY
jgi:periplasmic protein TonB